MRYEILESITTSGLEDLVDKRLSLGWLLIGGVAVSTSGWFLQAVYKP